MIDVSKLPDGLEEAMGKLNSMVGLLAHLADVHDDDDLTGTFHSLLNLARSIRAEFIEVVEGEPDDAAR